MNADGRHDEDWMGAPGWALERIMTETGRDAVDAERLRRSLSKIEPSLRNDLLAWWREATVDMDREIAGWSIRRLLNEGWCKHVTPAFTWLDGLLRFREDTLQMLKEPRCELVFDEKTKAAAIKKSSH